MDRAVFLDRDGVINDNVYYSDSGEWEGPRSVTEFRPIPEAFSAMRKLAAAGYLLFIVSNQPNQAKAKATRSDHDAIHGALLSLLNLEEINVEASFYCFHHPNGIVPTLSGPCRCRKPSPYFIFEAAERWKIDLTNSWMVGDRNSDVACGEAAGVRTILITADNIDVANFCAPSLSQAAEIILRARPGKSESFLPR